MWIRQIKVSTAIIACSFIISFFINNSFPTAYASFASLLKKVQGDIIQIFHETPDKESTRVKTLPLVEEQPPFEYNSGSSFPPEKTSLEEAENKIAFPLLTPSYIPKNLR